MEKKHVTVGPFGSHCGEQWNDGTYNGVKQVVIFSGNVIDSIQFEYDQNGCSVWSKKHGESNGGNKHVVKFNYPSEFLKSISGSYGERCNRIVLQSLVFETNAQKYGPFGKAKGTHFSFPAVDGKVVGFFGRSGANPEAIGAYIEPHRYLAVGPFGGHGGQVWNDGTYTAIRQMIIHVGSLVDSIQIEYDLNGRSKWSEKHGISPGGTKHVVKFDFPNEFLISISGYLSEDSTCAIVRSLIIETNKRKYGPFGAEKGKYFTTTCTSGQIIGFFGRSGRLVDAIGAYVKPFPTPNHSLSAGPVGGCGGHKWDDGIHTTVREVVIYSGSAIDSFQVEYDNNGRSFWAEKHGQSKGGVKNMIKLDYPGEFIISISGYSSMECGVNVIRSLKIETNKRTYGPFGKEVGDSFCIPNESGKIVGFHGKSGYYLDAIGVHYEPLPNPSGFLSVGPFGGCNGCPFDDGTYSTIRQIIVYAGCVIVSIQTEYDNKGRSKWSEKYGSSTCGNKNMVKLDYPGEFLISVHGHYSHADGGVVIRSLTFESNKKTYGPFGAEEGTAFKLPPTSGKIIGFHGKAGEYLDSLGAYYEPLCSP